MYLFTLLQEVEEIPVLHVLHDEEWSAGIVCRTTPAHAQNIAVAPYVDDDADFLVEQFCFFFCRILWRKNYVCLVSNMMTFKQHISYPFYL